MKTMWEEDPAELLGLEEEGPMDLSGSEDEEEEEPTETMSLGGEEEGEEDDESFDLSGFGEEEDPSEMSMGEEDDDEEEEDEGPDITQRIQGLRAIQGLRKARRRTRVLGLLAIRNRRRAKLLAALAQRKQRRAILDARLAYRNRLALSPPVPCPNWAIRRAGTESSRQDPTSIPWPLPTPSGSLVDCENLAWPRRSSTVAPNWGCSRIPCRCAKQSKVPSRLGVSASLDGIFQGVRQPERAVIRRGRRRSS